MIIGTNRETKSGEHRVALLPGGVSVLVGHGHRVLFQPGAGEAAGFGDEVYVAAGAELVDANRIFGEAQLIYKVKEPMPWEYDLLRPGQLLFTFIHSAGNRALCEKLLEHRVLGVAFEDVTLDDGRMPMLEPMSRIAGYMGLFKGFELLQVQNGGPGLMPGGLTAVAPTRVTILGAGSVGLGALTLAHGAGADVTILDVSLPKLEYVSRHFPRARTRHSDAANIEAALAQTDILLNGVMWPRNREGHLVTREMLSLMPSGAVIVDVSADISGAIETCERQTTHDDPVYVVDGVRHYTVANIPALVAKSASEALANVTLPFAVQLARDTYGSLHQSAPLRRGITCIDGEMVRPATADWLGCSYLEETELKKRLAARIAP